MGESGVVLRGMLVSLTSKKGREFVIDCCRNAEGALSDDEVREKYGLSLEAWQNSVNDQALMQAVQAEHHRRRVAGVAAAGRQSK